MKKFRIPLIVLASCFLCNSSSYAMENHKITPKDNKSGSSTAKFLEQEISFKNFNEQNFNQNSNQLQDENPQKKLNLNENLKNLYLNKKEDLKNAFEQEISFKNFNEQNFNQNSNQLQDENPQKKLNLNEELKNLYLNKKETPISFFEQKQKILELFKKLTKEKDEKLNDDLRSLKTLKNLLKSIQSQNLYKNYIVEIRNNANIEKQLDDKINKISYILSLDSTELIKEKLKNFVDEYGNIQQQIDEAIKIEKKIHIEKSKQGFFQIIDYTLKTWNKYANERRIFIKNIKNLYVDYLALNNAETPNEEYDNVLFKLQKHLLDIFYFYTKNNDIELVYSKIVECFNHLKNEEKTPQNNKYVEKLTMFQREYDSFKNVINHYNNIIIDFYDKNTDKCKNYKLDDKYLDINVWKYISLGNRTDNVMKDTKKFNIKSRIAYFNFHICNIIEKLKSSSKNRKNLNIPEYKYEYFLGWRPILEMEEAKMKFCYNALDSEKTKEAIKKYVMKLAELKKNIKTIAEYYKLNNK